MHVYCFVDYDVCDFEIVDFGNSQIWKYVSQIWNLALGPGGPNAKLFLAMSHEPWATSLVNEPWAMSHDSLTMDNKLINALFD